MKEKPLPLFLFPSESRTERNWLTQLKKKGVIYSAGPRLYTSVPKSSLESAVQSSWQLILSNLFPKALLSHRSAFEYRPTPEGNIFLTSTTNRKITYPGLTLCFGRGPSALRDDVPFMGFRASSLPRALLENLMATKNMGEKKTLNQEEVEKKLEQILHAKGEKELNNIRDRAKQISTKLNWNQEFKRLNGIIGALLGTMDAKPLRRQASQARAIGRPYDIHCLERLEFLFAKLRHYPIAESHEASTTNEHFKNKAFFEAYFSNYIEGTTFEIEEAEDIVFEHKIPPKRPKDAHDILVTFKIISDRGEIKKTPKTYEDLERLLKVRHGVLMEQRPEVTPGLFKEKPNRAGATQFVAPEYVIGTLEQGFTFYKDLPLGFARATYLMFLIAEVHPFSDGNGRIARIFLNAELYSEGLATVIIPTVYRDDYLSALRALSRRHRAEPVIEMLLKAQKFSCLDFSSYPKSLKHLKSHNWFQEPDEAQWLP